MVDYNLRSFDFSAPIKFLKRQEKLETPNQPYRSDFMRDRDRVMYSASFRRLSGKTQIYLAGRNDNQRNRLTHTLEVAQIARTVSHALGLNCDLTEAIALGHDLGHSPFGHAGEQVLHEIMVPDSTIHIDGSPMAHDSGLLSDATLRKAPLFGFKHNVQSVRVAVSIENNYGRNGLNLTNYTLWGILHHSSTAYKKGTVNTVDLIPEYQNQYNKFYELLDYPGKEAWSFEAFVVAESDEIAQWHHDLEDALRGNAMSGADVCKAISKNLSGIMSSGDMSMLQNLKNRKLVDRKYVTDISRIVVNTLVNRLIECSFENLNYLWKKYAVTPDSKNDFFLQHSWDEPEIKEAISLSLLEQTDTNVSSLKKQYPSIISEKIHHSREVERMNAKGKYIIKKLFQAYFSHPQQLPDSVIIQYMIDVKQYKNVQSVAQVGTGAVRAKFEKFYTNRNAYNLEHKISLMRRICDHIAGMTDHYAIEEYNNLYG